jgi:Mg2+ and Co2+ transporter CorA
METKDLLPRTWEVPQIFRDRLGSKAGRQRSMSADGHLLLVLHLPPGPDDDERQGRFLWRRPDGTWTSSDLGSSQNVVNKHLDQYAEAIQACDDREERAATAEAHFDVLDRLAPIYRAARHLHQVLQEARQLIPEDRNLINYRDRAYEIERTAELLHSDTKNALDVLTAKKAEEQAQSSHRMAVSAHRLNMLVAFFFPLATLSGILGVNLLHGLENKAPPFLFLTFLGVGLVSGLMLMAFVGTGRR